MVTLSGVLTVQVWDVRKGRGDAKALDPSEGFSAMPAISNPDATKFVTWAARWQKEFGVCAAGAESRADLGDRERETVFPESLAS